MSVDIHLECDIIAMKNIFYEDWKAIGYEGIDVLYRTDRARPRLDDRGWLFLSGWDGYRKTRGVEGNMGRNV